MMKIPFFTKRESAPPTENRQGAYTDAITASIIAASQAVPNTDIHQTAAVEIAAGVIGRAFAAATVEGTELADSVTLSAIARDMVTHGQSVYVLREDTLLPATLVEVAGSAARHRWRYNVEITSPGGRTFPYQAGWGSVLHARYSYDARHPWIGIGPLGRPNIATALAARLEASLRDEGGTTVGYLLPVPVDGNDASIEGLKADLKTLRGRTSVVETTAGGWGEGRLAAPRNDYVPSRIGPAPPQATVQLHSSAMLAILAICGVPIELVQSADGTGQREAWRRFLHGTLQPIGSIIEVELSRLAGRPVAISHEKLFASDIAGKARAFQSLVGGGMSIQEAATQTGLLSQD